MTNLVLFTNSVLSYLLVVIAFVVVGALGGLIGYNMRKRKDAKESKSEDKASVSD